MERQTETFVGETDFTSLADNLGILFRLDYGSRNQLFKLSKRRQMSDGGRACPQGKIKSTDERNLYGLREGMR